MESIVEYAVSYHLDGIVSWATIKVMWRSCQATGVIVGPFFSPSPSLA